MRPFTPLILATLIACGWPAAPAFAALVPLPPSHNWKRKQRPPQTQPPAPHPDPKGAEPSDGPGVPADMGEEIDLEALFETQVEVATKRAESLVNAPAVVSALNADEIRERGYMSVAEALRALPGFYVVDDYLTPSAGVRGIPSGQRAWSRIIKVMVDGHPVAYRPESTNFLGPELVPIDVVKRIEVIRGPGSALYGADAFLGVVNIITKRGEDIAGGAINADGGAFAGHPQYGGSVLVGTPLASTGLGPKMGDAEVVLAGALSAMDRSGLASPGLSPFAAKWAGSTTQGDFSRPASVFGRIGSLGTPLGQFTFDGLYQRLDSAGEFQDWRPMTHQNHIVLENRMVRAALRSAPTARIATSATAAYTRGGPANDDRIGTGSSQFTYRREMATDSVDATLEGSYAFTARDSVTFGADVARNLHQLPTYYSVFSAASGREGQEQQAGLSGELQNFTNVGVYGQGITHLFEDTALTTGLRLDAHNIYGPVFNGRAAIVHPLAQGLVAKALYGSSFKAPSPQQLFGRPLIFGDIRGASNLRPERAQTVEAALAWNPGRQLELTADAYYTHVSDRIGFRQAAGNATAVNLSESDSVGFETELKWRWQFLHGMFNASLQRTAALEPDELSGEIVTALPEAYPAYMLNAGVGAPLGKLPLSLFLEGRHVAAVGSTQSNYAANGSNQYELPAATVLDATLSSRDWYWGDRSLNVVFKAANIFDADYAQPGYGGIDYQGRGRTLWVRLGCGF